VFNGEGQCSAVLRIFKHVIRLNMNQWKGEDSLHMEFKSHYELFSIGQREWSKVQYIKPL